MKKFITSFVFVFVFAAYAVSQFFEGSSVAYSAATTSSPSGQTIAGNTQPAQQTFNDPTPPQPIATTQPQAQTPQAVPTPTPTLTPEPTPTPAPVPKPQGEYVDGTYTGSVANAYYGNVQVEAVVSGGKISDVRFLQYPNDRSTSRFINQQAMPILASEAIQIQSAQVDGVSGASDTSAAFQQSLASALSQAKS